MRWTSLFIMSLVLGCDTDDKEGLDTGGVIGDTDTDTDDPVDEDCFFDADGDGYGDPLITAVCGDPDAVELNTDCDDADNDIFPGADEFCDAIDNNCDGLVDGEDSLDASPYYADNDGDAFGDEADVVYSCRPVEGRVEESTDCNDDDVAIFPGADESCYDSIDSNCDGADNFSGCSFSLEFADATFVGENDVDRAGYSLAPAGDMNGDGFGDIINSARLNDLNPEDDDNAGAAYIVYAPFDGEISLSDADVKLTGEDAGDRFGSYVDGNMDFDGDGNVDMIVGAAAADDDTLGETGAAYVFYGPVSSGSAADADIKATGSEAGEEVGLLVAFIGDMNADGKAEALIAGRKNSAVENDNGAAYLLFGGSSSGSMATSAVTLLGTGAGDRAGYAVARAGDFDGDGNADAMINAYRADDPDLETEGNNVGVTYVVAGGSSGLVGTTTSDVTHSLADADLIIYGEQIVSQTGSMISPAGDVNDDGFDDILLGAQDYDYLEGEDDDTGLVYLLLGSMDGLSGDAVRINDVADATLLGEGSADFAGRGVASVGDINDDDFDDILIGAKTNAEGGSRAGAAYLVLGPMSGSMLLRNANGRFYSHIAEAQSGTNVAPAGDVDGDDKPDFLISGASADEGYGFLVLGDDW
ncbi:MAG: MopE-related protein [Myxococcota bacterium]